MKQLTKSQKWLIREARNCDDTPENDQWLAENTPDDVVWTELTHDLKTLPPNDADYDNVWAQWNNGVISIHKAWHIRSNIKGDEFPAWVVRWTPCIQPQPPEVKDD